MTNELHDELDRVRQQLDQAGHAVMHVNDSMTLRHPHPLKGMTAQLEVDIRRLARRCAGLAEQAQGAREVASV